jgi:drug/metabolite transporter (DMT)-like permease
VLSFTNVMFTVLLAAPLLGERVDRWRWFGAHRSAWPGWR